MTVAATTNRKTYTGDNVTTSFATSPVIFYATSDLQVRVTVIATGVSTLLTLNTHYTVSGGSSAGAVGTVSLAGGSSPHGALLSTEKLVILRVLPLTQGVDFVNNNNSDAEVLEAALDKLTDVDQQIQEQADRSIRFASGDVSGSVTEIPDVTTRALKTLGFDSAGNLTTILMAVGGSLIDLATSIGSSLVGFIQAGAGAIVRTLQSKSRDIINSADFSTLQQAADAAAGRTLCVSGTNTLTAAVTLSSNTRIIFDGDAKVQTATANCSLFSATSKTGIHIEGGHFKSTVQGTTIENGMIYLDTCTHCSVVGTEFEGAQQAGVFLSNSSYCTVKDNYIHDSLGMTNATTDTYDINVYRASTYNLVEGNYCFGGAAIAVGINVQGAGATIPLGNKISKNFITVHSAYGILSYQVTAADVRTLIEGNTVQDIIGTYNAGSSGMGIYVQTSGGAIVRGNHVRNCMASTVSATNGAGAITLAFNGALRETSVVSGNHIDAPYWRGIFISDASCEVICSENYINFADGTNGDGIRITDCSYTSIINNRVKAAITVARSGISVLISSADCVGNNVSGNNITGTNGNLISFSFSSTFRHKKTRVIGNVCVSTGAAAQALVASGLSDSVISDNTLDAPAVGFYVDTAVNVRGAGNVVVQGATNGFLSGGTCSNTFFDASNYWGASSTLVQNTAAGVNIVWRAAVVPASGNWQRGDEWVLNAPAVSTSPGSYCVTAGAPGTWKARAALAA